MEGARGTGVDISAEACAVAAENARRLGLAGRAAIRRSDWFDRVGGSFDLIVANPPYVAPDEMAGLAPEVRDWEPRAALTDDVDGLEAYRTIFFGLKGRLLPGGRVIVEIGARQGRAVVDLAHRAGFTEVRLIRDLSGRDRVVSAEGPPDRVF